MSKAIKFKNGIYLDSSGITHKNEALKDILDNFISGTNSKLYHPRDLNLMTPGKTDKILDLSKSYIFYTDWQDYATYGQEFSGVLGVHLKSSGNTSTGGVVIIFHYAGQIGINIRIDDNRWGGWKWI